MYELTAEEWAAFERAPRPDDAAQDPLEPGRRPADGAWTTALDATLSRLVVREATGGSVLVSVEGGSSGALPQGTVVYAYDRANAARAIAGERYAVVPRSAPASDEAVVERAIDAHMNRVYKESGEPIPYDAREMAAEVMAALRASQGGADRG